MRRHCRLFILLLFAVSVSTSVSMCQVMVSNGTNCIPDNCCDNRALCCLGPCDGYPYLAYRSQSVNAARELVGWQEFLNKYCVDDFYGAFYAGFEYTRSFRPKQLAQFLFGNNLVGGNSLLIQGSKANNRDCRAWLADYFGLPTDFESRISFCPRIENFIVDLNLFVDLDALKKGIYLRFFTPLVHTRWDLNMCECVKNKGVNDFDPGYMSGESIESASSPIAIEIPREDLPNCFTQVMNGCVTFGDMKEPLKAGRMSTRRLTKTRLADIRVALGWNFLLEEDYHLGVHLRAAAPTGNRPNACYLFEPIVGNGKHWEFGSGFSWSYIFKRSCEYADHYWSVYFDANITHLFGACQCRSFDLCCKPNCRYMLLAEMVKNDINLRSESYNPDYRYNRKLIPAINHTTFNVNVKINLQADIALKFAYTRENWSFDVGYNLWARTGEKLCCDECCCLPCGSDRMFSIKGDSYLYGQEADVTKGLEEIVPISPSQQCATIHTGKNFPQQSTDDIPETNPRIDNPQGAIKNEVLVTLPFAQEVLAEGTLAAIDKYQIDTSVNPYIVKLENISLCKSPSAITHKLFAHINYAWIDNCNKKYTPFFGVGGEIELAPYKKCCCAPRPTTCNDLCNDCCDPYDCCCNKFCGKKKRAGVSQWGLWVKVGVSCE